MTAVGKIIFLHNPEQQLIYTVTVIYLIYLHRFCLLIVKKKSSDIYTHCTFIILKLRNLDLVELFSKFKFVIKILMRGVQSDLHYLILINSKYQKVLSIINKLIQHLFFIIIKLWFQTRLNCMSNINNDTLALLWREIYSFIIERFICKNNKQQS